MSWASGNNSFLKIWVNDFNDYVSYVMGTKNKRKTHIIFVIYILMFLSAYLLSHLVTEDVAKIHFLLATSTRVLATQR